MKRLFPNLVILGTLALSALPLYAADPDGKPDTSVYDKHPDCMTPSAFNVPVPDPAVRNTKCLINDGPRGKVIGAEGAAAATLTTPEVLVPAPGAKVGGTVH
jgi:hypothetical protein